MRRRVVIRRGRQRFTADNGGWPAGSPAGQVAREGTVGLRPWSSTISTARQPVEGDDDPPEWHARWPAAPLFDAAQVRLVNAGEPGDLPLCSPRRQTPREQPLAEHEHGPLVARMAAVLHEHRIADEAYRPRTQGPLMTR
jgi:hypothetical protein